MLLYWQFNTEPKCGRRKQEQPRRCAPHIENLVTVPSQQSAQRSTSNTEAYRQSQHRTPHHNPRTQNFLGTTFHIQHRSKQTKVNTAPHTTTQELKTPSAQRSTSNTEAYRQKSTPLHIPTTQELLKKSPRGVQRGRGFTAPLRFSTASQSKKKQALCQESKNKPNHTINKEKE